MARLYLSNPDPLIFVQRSFIVAPVVQLSGARGGMVRHLLRILQGAFTFQVIGDSGGAQTVIADVGVPTK